MMRKRLKAAAAAAMALVMLGGTLPAMPCGTKLLNAPLTAHAAGSAVFDQDTRTLTLNGNVTKEQIWEYRTNDAVKSVVAAEGCVLPEDCSELFDGGDWNMVYYEDTFEWVYYRRWERVYSIDLSKADASKVTNMSHMFSDAPFLFTINLNGLDTSNVTDMSGMFENCGVSDLNLIGVDTSKVTDMNRMFAYCLNLRTLNLSSFDTSNVTDMRYMFRAFKDLAEYCSVIDSSTYYYEMGEYDYHIDLTPLLDVIYVSDLWNTDAVTKSDEMFQYNLALAGGAGTAYDENHTDKEYARIDGKDGKPGYLCKNGTVPLRTVKLNKETGVLTLSGNIVKNQLWIYRNNRTITSVVAADDCVLPEDCSDLFNSVQYKYYYSRYEPTGWSNVTSIDLSKADFSHVTNANHMFSKLKELTSLNLNGIDTSNITDMESMFEDCSSLKTLDLSSFDTSNVTNMSRMFYECYKFSSIDISNFDTSNVTNMNSMFAWTCFTELDLSSFDTSKVTDMSGMFNQCYYLKTIYASDLWNADAVTESHAIWGDMGALQGGAGTKISGDMSDIEYARIDNPPDEPGYLTYKAPLKNYVKGVSLSLDGTIHINFYTVLTDSVKKAVLSGPYYEEEITDFQKVKKGPYKGYTKLSYGVNATQRTDKVSLRLYDKDGNLLDLYNSSMQKVPDNVIRYSVKDYFENYTGEPRENDTETLTEERNTLVEWLERYMKAAENYFLGKTHTILPEGFMPRWFDIVNETHGAYKLGMVLNSGTDLLIYTDADRVVHKQYSGDVDLEKYTDKAGRSCFIMRNFSAAGTVGSEEIEINGETYYVCPRDYCAYAVWQCEEGSAMWDLIWAFYEYSKAAEYYTFDCTDD